MSSIVKYPPSPETTPILVPSIKTVAPSRGN
jgi:hypothetical protein